MFQSCSRVFLLSSSRWSGVQGATFSSSSATSSGAAEIKGDKSLFVAESVPSFLASRAKEYPEKDVLRACDHWYDGTVLKWTWKELQFFTDALASGLDELNVRSGQRLLSLLPNGPENLVALLAAGKLGASTVFLDEHAPDGDVEKVLADRARVVFFSTVGSAEKQDPRINFFRSAVSPDLTTSPSARFPELKLLAHIGPYNHIGIHNYSDLFLENPLPSPLPPIAARLRGGQATLASYYNPSKPAERLDHSHAALVTSAIDIAQKWGLTPESRVLAALPLHGDASAHAAALAPLAARGLVIVSPQDSEAVADNISKEQASHLVVRPSLLKNLLQRHVALSRAQKWLQHILVVANKTDALSPDLIAATKSAFSGATISLAYSNPLVPGFLFQSTPNQSGAATVGSGISYGSPSPSLSVKIVGDNGSTAAYGTTGDIHIQGPLLAHPYHDSWTNTGLKGSLASDGRVTIE